MASLSTQHILIVLIVSNQTKPSIGHIPSMDEVVDSLEQSLLVWKVMGSIPVLAKYVQHGILVWQHYKVPMSVHIQKPIPDVIRSHICA